MRSSETDDYLESSGSQVGDRTSSLRRVREWFLVDGDRLFVATGISLGVFVLLVLLAEVGVISFVNDDSITRLAGGMIAGTFSLVTLVVSINQLILSREFTAAPETRERLDGVMEFRSDIADAANVPTSPAAPMKILEVLVETIHQRADALDDATGSLDGEGRDEIVQFVEAVEARTERVEETLEGPSSGTAGAISAAVSFDDGWQLYVARGLRARHAETLSEEAHQAFDDLIEGLELFNVGREHFKTTYLQRELTRFSQLTIYCGVPAVLSAILIGLLYADLGGATISLVYLPLVVSALIAVVFSPLALLVSFILRTAAVTRRTSSIGPMLPEKDPDEGPFDVTVEKDGASPGEGGGVDASGGDE